MSTPECTKLMRAVTETQYNADFNTGLAMGDVPLPEPDPAKNEVRVQVLFASTNPVDYKIARGDLAAFHKVKLPAPVGRDFSGIVHAVPEGIENPAGVKVGDRVCGFLSVTDPTKGSMAEYCTCPAKILAKVPDGVSMKEAAVVGLAGNTAYHGLVDNLKFGPNCGKKLLVLGGSTATGMFALQIARHFNCPAIACTSTSEELCKSLGATKVIDYRKEDWSEVLRGEEYDAVFDAMGGYQSYVDSAKVLKKSGTFYSIVGDHPDGTLSFGKMVGVAGAIAFRGRFLGPYYKIAISLPSTPDHGLRFFLGLMAEGKAKAVLDPAEPFEFSQAGAVAMFNKQASGRCKGKLLMCVRAE